MSYDANMARAIGAASKSKYAGDVATLIPQEYPDLQVSDAELDALETELAVPGGQVIDLLTGELRPSTMEALHTKRLALVPDLTRSPMQLLRWLGDALDHDQARIDFLQESFGSAFFISSAPQSITVIRGPGDNGKSALVDLVLRLLGTYAKTGDIGMICGKDEDEQKKALQGVYDARLTILEELENAVVDSGALKRATGGGEVNLKKLYKDGFTARMRATIIATSNKMPRFSRMDDGVARRLNILTMPHKIPKSRIDKQFVPKLIEAEGQAVLGWMVQGAMRYAARGYSFGDLPAAVLQERRLIEQEGDPVSFAIKQAIERGGPKDRLSRPEARKVVASVLADLLDKEAATVGLTSKQLSAQLAEIFDATCATAFKSGNDFVYPGLRLTGRSTA